MIARDGEIGIAYTAQRIAVKVHPILIIGMMNGSTFVKYTNFNIRVKAVAATPTGFNPCTSGFVFDVTSNDGMSK